MSRRPGFDDAEDFSEGLAAVGANGSWGFIDRRGRVVIGPRFETDDLHDYKFSEGLAEVELKDKKGMHYRNVGMAIVTALVTAFVLLCLFSAGAAAHDSPLPLPEAESAPMDSGRGGLGRNGQGRTGGDRPHKPDTPPEKLSLCELKKDPGAYNHKLIEVTGFVSHGFEDFTLFDPVCSSWPEVWLEYGGTSKSGTMYCCGVTADRKRPKPLVVENIAVPLVDDARFREFDTLLQRRPDSVVHATLVGRFFAGEQVKYPKGSFWGGYGHMGCCSLLAIQQVLSVDTQDRPDLDYGASADQPDMEKTGCGYRFLTDIRPHEALLKAQRAAEREGGEWAFAEPQRVASDSLARLLNIDEKTLTGLGQTRKGQGRFVYEWRPKAKGVSYMVVVSHPYWLAFYAKDPQRVAWVVIAAYKSSCGGDNSVTRIR